MEPLLGLIRISASARGEAIPGLRHGAPERRLNAIKAPSGRDNYISFHGMSLRSISWNSTAEINPRMPITTMPTNM